MKYIILFEDALDADPDTRKTYMSQHLEFLKKNADKIEAAGPLSDPERKGRDGMWIVDAQNEAEADRLVKEDPFWPTGLRKSYVIIKWTQVFAHGTKLVSPG